MIKSGNHYHVLGFKRQNIEVGSVVTFTWIGKGRVLTFTISMIFWTVTITLYG